MEADIADDDGPAGQSVNSTARFSAANPPHPPTPPRPASPLSWLGNSGKKKGGKCGFTVTELGKELQIKQETR